MLPSSSQVRKKTAEDQDIDEEIKWIKDLILKHGQEKPKIIEFVNTNQRIFYKEYSNQKPVRYKSSAISPPKTSG